MEVHSWRLSWLEVIMVKGHLGQRSLWQEVITVVGLLGWRSSQLEGIMVRSNPYLTRVDSRIEWRKGRMNDFSNKADRHKLRAF